MEGNANPFPPATEAEWRRLVERALGGRPLKPDFDDFRRADNRTLYQRQATEAGHALRQKPGAWALSQRMDHPDIATANAMACADLDGGADALTLTIFGAFAARGFGVKIAGRRDLDAVLAGIDLDRIALRVDAGARALELAPSFASIARDRRLTTAALDVDFGHDPFGQFARSGLLPPSLHAVAGDSGAVARRRVCGRLMLADGGSIKRRAPEKHKNSPA